jgi:hypothetical protein
MPPPSSEVFDFVVVAILFDSLLLIGDIADKEAAEEDVVDVVVVVLEQEEKVVLLLVLVGWENCVDSFLHCPGCVFASLSLHCFGYVSASPISTVVSFVVKLNSASSCEPDPKQHSGMLNLVRTVLVLRCTFSPSV